MFPEIKELRLSETYTFHVLVRSGDEHFAADLHVSPEIVTLKIMGEIDEDRSIELDHWKIDELRCTSLRDSFLLLGLSLIEGSWRLLGRSRRYFERSYEVRELFHAHSGRGISRENKALRIDLHSATVAQWLGNTKLQHEVVGHHHDGRLRLQPHGFNVELICEADEDSALVVYYDVIDGYSLSDFRSQMSFLPVAGLECRSNNGLLEMPQRVDDLLAVLSFVCGGPLELDRITFQLADASLGTTGSYYRKGLGRKVEKSHQLTLIPFNSLPTGEAREESPSWEKLFRAYFQLAPDLRGLFKKYLKYRTLTSLEERFLGYFRLLEKTTIHTATFVDSTKLEALLTRTKPLLKRHFDNKKGVESLLRGILRLNESKYNTEKCIALLWLRLPCEMTTTWKFETKDLAHVCKLRNDMVHANDHRISEDELLSMMVLTDLLLTTALAERLCIPIGMSKDYLLQHPKYSQIVKAQA